MPDDKLAEPTAPAPTECCCKAHHVNFGRCLQCPIHGINPPPVCPATVGEGRPMPIDKQMTAEEHDKFLIDYAGGTQSQVPTSGPSQPETEPVKGGAAMFDNQHVTDSKQQSGNTPSGQPMNERVQPSPPAPLSLEQVRESHVATMRESLDFQDSYFYRKLTDRLNALLSATPPASREELMLLVGPCKNCGFDEGVHQSPCGTPEPPSAAHDAQVREVLEKHDLRRWLRMTTGGGEFDYLRCYCGAKIREDSNEAMFGHIVAALNSAPASASHCHAGSDGECNWAECPQEANNRANYQTVCPLYKADDE